MFVWLLNLSPPWSAERFRTCDNRLLRKIFGSKRGGYLYVMRTRAWYCRVIRLRILGWTMCEAALHDAEFRFQGKEPLLRSRRRRKGKMKMDFREIGWDDMKCIG